MEITTNVPHPTIPGFVTTIRHVDRVAQLKAMSEVEQKRQPFIVLDPRNNEPIIINGEPIITWKPVNDGDVVVQHLNRFILGWSGLKLHGKDVPFDPANVKILLDPALDAPHELEVNDKGAIVKKTVTLPWPTILEYKAKDRRSFDVDPLESSSAT